MIIHFEFVSLNQFKDLISMFQMISSNLIFHHLDLKFVLSIVQAII